MPFTASIRGFAICLISTFAIPAFAASQAPTGTYTATTGASAATASGGGRMGGGARAGGSAARGRGATSGVEATSGGSITMNVASWSTQADAEQLSNAQAGQQGNGVLAMLNSMNHGSVTVNGRQFPINAAFSVPKGSGHSIYLVSAKPFSGESSRGRAAGSTSGLIVLHVDSNGSGTGELYTSTQVVFESTGEVQARGGASTATKLTGVGRN